MTMYALQHVAMHIIDLLRLHISVHPELLSLSSSMHSESVALRTIIKQSIMPPF